jgi:hypothetical protein
MSRHLPPLVLTLALAFLPAAAWLEHADTQLWDNRLLWPTFEPEIDRHTPVHALGTFLPPVIRQDTVLSSANNPVILPSTTTISDDVSLTIEPGTKIYVHEYGRLDVAGHLLMLGTERQPIQLTSNEKHLVNRVWAGIVLQPKSRSTIRYTTIRYGSPAVTCQNDSQADIEHVLVEFGNLGLFTESDRCVMRDSIIHNVREAVAAVGVEPITINTTIDTQHSSISPEE